MLSVQVWIPLRSTARLHCRFGSGYFSQRTAPRQCTEGGILSALSQLWWVKLLSRHLQRVTNTSTMQHTEGIVFWFWICVCENFAFQIRLKVAEKMTAETKKLQECCTIGSDNSVIQITQWHPSFESCHELMTKNIVFLSICKHFLLTCVCTFTHEKTRLIQVNCWKWKLR